MGGKSFCLLDSPPQMLKTTGEMLGTQFLSISGLLAFRLLGVYGLAEPHPVVRNKPGDSKCLFDCAAITKASVLSAAILTSWGELGSDGMAMEWPWNGHATAINGLSLCQQIIEEISKRILPVIVVTTAIITTCFQSIQQLLKHAISLLDWQVAKEQLHLLDLSKFNGFFKPPRFQSPNQAAWPEQDVPSLFVMSWEWNSAKKLLKHLRALKKRRCLFSQSKVAVLTARRNNVKICETMFCQVCKHFYTENICTRQNPTQIISDPPGPPEQPFEGWVPPATRTPDIHKAQKRILKHN